MTFSEPLLEGESLSSLFERAQALYDATQDQDGPSAGDKMGECLLLMEECGKRVRQLSLFSPNEELDDVATTNLKYLLLPYMMADVAHRRPLLDRHDPLEASTSGKTGTSAGEKYADVSSSRLPYAAPSPDEMARMRLSVIRFVLQHVEEFVASCERLELMSKEDRLALQGSLDSSGSLDPATKRAVKVARFKKEKELRQKLDMLKARRAAAKRISIRRGTEGMVNGSSASSSGAGDGDTGDESVQEADSFVDEAEERGLWVAELQAAWVKAVDLEQSVRREEEMLKSAQEASQGQGMGSVARQPLTRDQLDRSLRERESSHRRAAAAAAAEGPIRVNPAAITCAVLAQDVIEGRVPHEQIANHRHTQMPMSFGPVSVIGSGTHAVNGDLGALSSLGARQSAAARVFQPSHSLPTMSIEEAGLREMKMMDDFKLQVKREMEEQGYQGVQERGPTDGGPPGADDEDGDEEKDEESDAAVMKARKWDDWKDENPWGKGNSKLTPCG